MSAFIPSMKENSAQGRKSQSGSGNNSLPSFKDDTFCLKNQVIVEVRTIATDLSWSHQSGPDQNIIVRN